ncbi:MAG: NYN domain-containing protein [Candidatus Margulisiibacteriota bacterium]
MHILIDGYNAAHKIPSVAAYFKESLEKVRNRLIDHLVSWRSAGGKGMEVTVVFDGRRDEIFCMPPSIKGIRVIFTNTGEEADDRIADMIRVAKDPASVSVVSDDNKIANACRSYGVKIHPVSFLNLPQNRKKPASSDYKPAGMAMDAITKELMNKWVAPTRER